MSKVIGLEGGAASLTARLQARAAIQEVLGCTLSEVDVQHDFHVRPLAAHPVAVHQLSAVEVGLGDDHLGDKVRRGSTSVGTGLLRPSLGHGALRRNVIPEDINVIH